MPNKIEDPFNTRKTKVCGLCKIELEILKFTPRTKNGKIYGVASYCKPCENLYKRTKRAMKKNIEYDNKVKDGIYKEKQIPKDENHKFCKYCGIIKDTNMFRHNRQKCMDCERKDGRKYRQDERDFNEHINEHINEDEIPQKIKTFSEFNKIKKQNIPKKLKSSGKLNTYPEYNHVRNFLERIRYALTHTNKDNEHNNFSFLGCSIPFYRKYLESNFDDKMTWKNFGTYWSIDHVIPLNEFDLTRSKDMELCLSWYNTEPLQNQLNKDKHTNIIFSQLINHINYLQNFVYKHINTRYKLILKGNINNKNSLHKKIDTNLEYYKLCSEYVKGYEL